MKLFISLRTASAAIIDSSLQVKFPSTQHYVALYGLICDWQSFLQLPLYPYLGLLRALHAHLQKSLFFLVVKLFMCLVIILRGGGVTTCNFDRMIPLFLPYLPVPTRTRNEGVRPQLFSPEVFRKK